MMRCTIDITAADVTPSVEAVLLSQGIPGDVDPDERLVSLARESIATFRELADPIALLTEISSEEFATVYCGQGKNEDETPLDDIRRLADDLALFAVTVGAPVCAEISSLFDDNDYARASMLDSAASEGTELATQVVVSYFRDYLQEAGRLPSSSAVLEFSPGYCGWHVSGQTTLFECLCPNEIGITLSDSCLMHPLKSISGVIVSGPGEIFEFDPGFVFCSDCQTQSCQDRVRTT
jgi:hypothetical protein